MSKPITECPNCDAVWTIGEIELQCCDACGYPQIEDEEEEDNL